MRPKVLDTGRAEDESFADEIDAYYLILNVGARHLLYARDCEITQVRDLIIRLGKVKEFTYALMELFPAADRNSTDTLIFAAATATYPQIALAAKRVIWPEWTEWKLSLETES